MARRVCRALILAYLFVYFAALAMAVIGTRGLFGIEPDAMSAVYLLFLGMPWVLAVLEVPVDSLPRIISQMIVALLPLVNLALLLWICRRRRRRRY